MTHFEKQINIFGHKIEFLGSKSDNGSEIKKKIGFQIFLQHLTKQASTDASIPTQKNHENDIFATISKQGFVFLQTKVYPNFKRGMWPQKTVCPARDKYQTCQQHKSVLHQLCDCQRMFKVVSICLVGEEKARQTLRRKRLTVRCNQAQYVCRGRILHFLPLNFSRFLLF